MKNISVSLPAQQAHPYSVSVGSNLLKDLPDDVSSLGNFDSIVVLHDEAVANIAQQIAESLQASLVIPVVSGEESKNLSQAEIIAESLLNNHATRQSLMVNVGGGMVTDLGGFVAHNYMRGMDTVNVPTTLLGMVDASVGGKTAVNVGNVKNSFGAFHQPRAVVADVDTLDTLPDEQIHEGMVEVTKIAAMRDADFFGWLEEVAEDILTKTRERLIVCIERSVQLKAEVCEEDEKESGVRMQLNFGHTVGHPIETLSGHTISHGQAVSIGMIGEMKMVGTPDTEVARIRDLLIAINMPVDIPSEIILSDIERGMRSDKKCVGGNIRIAVPKRIGEGTIITLE